MSIFAVPKRKFLGRERVSGEKEPRRSEARQASSSTTLKRRDAGVVDRAALEMRCTGNCTGGSNPSLSAKGV